MLATVFGSLGYKPIAVIMHYRDPEMAFVLTSHMHIVFPGAMLSP
jgi:hypothetical protein